MRAGQGGEHLQKWGDRNNLWIRLRPYIQPRLASLNMASTAAKSLEGRALVSDSLSGNVCLDWDPSCRSKHSYPCWFLQMFMMKFGSLLHAAHEENGKNSECHPPTAQQVLE